MSRIVVAVVGLVAALTLATSIGSLLLGIAALVASLEAEELSKLYGLSLGIVAVIVGVVLFVPGLELVHATRALRAAAPGLPATTARSRLVSGGVALLAGMACLAPAALGAAGGRPDSLVTIASLAGTLLCATAAWTARFFPEQALGNGLLLLALLGGGLAGWVSVGMLDVQGPVEITRGPADDRSDQVLDGPRTGDIARDVGSVGTWIPIAGGTLPTILGDDGPTSPEEILAELRGQPVRFALIGQCSMDREAAWLTAELLVASGASAGESSRRQVALSPVRCDGTIHTSVSVEVALPTWLDPSTPDIGRQAWFSAAVATTTYANAQGTRPQRARRWLIYVSPEPASAVEDVAREIAGYFDPLPPVSPTEPHL